MSYTFHDPRLLDEDTVQAYTSSHCDHLAMALVQRGYNPGIFATVDEDGQIMGDNFSHAFIVIEDPKNAGNELFVDIQGIQTRGEILEAWDEICYEIAIDDGGYDFAMFTGIQAMPAIAKADIDDHDLLLADLIIEEIEKFVK